MLSVSTVEGQAYPEFPVFAWSPGGPEGRSVGEIFGEIYDSGMWGEDESRSGFGSNLVQTSVLRAALPRLVADLRVRSFLDIPCGDMFWMSTVDLGVREYVGADVVPEVVASNTAKFARPGREFQVLDVMRDDLPRVDLVFSRDCLVHFSDTDVFRALENVKRSGSAYFAATTFVGRAHNTDISTGGWRTLNLRAEPFCLPEPVALIDEQCTEAYQVQQQGAEIELRFTDKSLGVWRVAELP